MRARAATSEPDEASGEASGPAGASKPVPAPAGASKPVPELDGASKPVPGLRPRHPWGSLAVLCTSLLIISLDDTILTVALPAIVRALHASSSELQLIVDSYIVVLAGLLVLVGSVGDRVGRKWVFLTGLVVFAAGSATSAFCTTPDLLIAARAVMGLGSAAIMPSTLSILTDVFTAPSERARAIGIWSGTAGLGVAIGPVAGGWLLSHFWWGSVFLVNVPIVIVSLVAACLLVPNSRSRAAPKTDPAGGLLSVVGMASLLWGIIEAPNRGWTSPVIIGALAIGAATLTVFVAFEMRSPSPMLHTALFRSRRFSAAVAAMGLVIFALMGALFLLTQYLQFSLGYTPLQAGVRVAPVAAVVLVTAPLSTLLVRLIGTKPVVFAGMASVGVGFVLLSVTTVNGGYLDALPGMFLLGAGTGLALAPSTESVMGSVPREWAGVGSATNGAALQTGGALGVAVLGSVLNDRYQARLSPLLAGRGVPSSIAHLITGSLGGALQVASHVGGSLGGALTSVAKAAFVSGMDLALAVGAAVVFAAALAVVGLLPNRAEPAVDDAEVVPGAATSAEGSRALGDRADPDATDGSGAGPSPPGLGQDEAIGAGRSQS